MASYNGQCNCGSLAFTIDGAITQTTACYCRMCCAQGGVFYSAVVEGNINIKNDKTLTWYSASGKAERGFCSQCGSSLFWKPNDDATPWDVNLSAIDGVDDIALTSHIFTAHKPGYITIPDDAPHDPRLSSDREDG